MAGVQRNPLLGDKTGKEAPSMEWRQGREGRAPSLEEEGQEKQCPISSMEGASTLCLWRKMSRGIGHPTF